MAIKKRPIRAAKPGEGKKKFLDCVACFETCIVDQDTKRVLCGRCVVQGGKL